MIRPSSLLTRKTVTPAECQPIVAGNKNEAVKHFDSEISGAPNNAEHIEKTAFLSEITATRLKPSPNSPSYDLVGCLPCQRSYSWQLLFEPIRTDMMLDIPGAQLF